MEQSKPLSGDHKDFDNFKQKIGKHYGSEVVFNETGVRDKQLPRRVPQKARNDTILLTPSGGLM